MLKFTLYYFSLGLILFLIAYLRYLAIFLYASRNMIWEIVCNFIWTGAITVTLWPFMAYHKIKKYVK